VPLLSWRWFWPNATFGAPCGAPAVTQGSVIPVFSRRLSMTADVASVQFSRTVERRVTPAGLRVCRSSLWWPREARRAPVSQNSTACWGRFAAAAWRARQVVSETCGVRPSSQVRSTC